MDLQDIPIHDLNFCALCYWKVVDLQEIYICDLNYLDVRYGRVHVTSKIFASLTLTTVLYVIAACRSAGQAEGE